MLTEGRLGRCWIRQQQALHSGKLLRRHIFVKYDVCCYCRECEINESVLFSFLAFFFFCLFSCVNHWVLFFWLVSCALLVVSRASWLQHWHENTMPARGAWPCLRQVRSLACFFPGKARSNLPLMPAACLAESRKMTGRWVYSGKMAKGKDKPNQLLCSASCSTPSSTSSKM